MQSFGVERLPSAVANPGSGIPQHAGVYLVYAPQYGILYVGSSKNIRSRWQQHHWRYQLIAIKGARVAWISVDAEAVKLRRALENTLIARLRPPINTQAGSSDISLRQQWFRRFEHDGHHPDFDYYKRRRKSNHGGKSRG